MADLILVALALNLSGQSGKGITTATKDCRQYLIRQYIERCDPERLPIPDFIALQDGVTRADISNMREAFKSRHTSPKDRFDAVNNADISSSNAQLLFNTGKLTHVRDFHGKDWALVESDYFKDEKSISSRVSGGIFQHKKSAQFIVAVSYHGFNQNKPVAQNYLKGLLTNLES
jgi:hypothetical protein